MNHDFTRRCFLGLGAGLGLAPRFAALKGFQRMSPPLQLSYDKPATVSLIHGEERRKNVYEALKAIEDEIGPKIRQKSRVVVKPNDVSTRMQLASTHADALRGILDFLEPYKKPVAIAESSAGNTWEAFEEFLYDRLPGEYKGMQVELVDLNSEGLYEVIHIVDADIHPVPVRLAKRLLDPEAFILCSAIMKTHNVVVATMSVKNMTLGAPLRSGPKETASWNDKRHYHGGVRQTQFDIFLTAQKMQPYWGATVIDGFEGMEGNGPGSGTPVDSRIAIASTDFIAADRVGVEAMGVDPTWMGYLVSCSQGGLGQYDLAKINVIGARIEEVQRKYLLHRDIERQLQWMGPMEELPPKLG